MCAFELLHSRLKRVLREEGYRTPTPIQEKAIPLVLKGLNLLIMAPTGSGKTEAVFFPILSKLLEEEVGKGIYVLYITPLRALNRDIFWRMSRLASKLGFKMAVRHGDTPESVRRRMAREPPHILVTTPETLQFLLVGRRIRMFLAYVKWVIIDEVHELVGEKRGNQLAIAIERLRELTGRSFQRIGLSATISDIEVARRFIGKRVYVVQDERLRKPEIKVIYVGEEEDDAEKIAELIKGERGSVLLFTNTRDSAEALTTRLLPLLDVGIRVHHGSLSRDERVVAEEMFKRGEIKVMVATSSLELGIDIGHVDVVIQYMSPRQAIKLAQRVGRSKHFLHGIPRGYIITLSPDDLLESIVLARRISNNEFEPFERHWKPYDVLAHQIIGIAIERGGKVSLEEIYRIVIRAFSYEDLTLSELTYVLGQLEAEGLIILDRGKVICRRGSFEYYFENASMIPDTVKFKVKDLSSMRVIGELDEDFVALRCEEGFMFILSGRVWRVVSVDNDNLVVNVVPSTQVEGALPAWEGEMIPVDFKVAREVGSLWRRIKLYLENKYSIETILDIYPISIDNLNVLINHVRKQLEKGFPVPDDKTLVIEHLGKSVVIHLCAGSKVNEALGLYLSRYIFSLTGYKVLYTVDPYRILLSANYPINIDHVIQGLKEDEENVVRELIQAIKDSSIYKWRILHVAKRFGVLPRRESVRLSKKLLKALEESPISEEAVKEVLTEKVDKERLLEILRFVKEGKISLIIVKSRGVSPFARTFLENRVAFRGLEIPVPSVLAEAIKKRIERTTVTLICLHCLSTWTSTIAELPEKLRCRKCGSVFLAVSPPSKTLEYLKILRRIRRKYKIKGDERKIWERLSKSSKLVASYGKKAVIVLAGRGIGPTTASKILSKHLEGIGLYMEILRAEQAYAKTRPFWD